MERGGEKADGCTTVEPCARWRSHANDRVRHHDTARQRRHATPYATKAADVDAQHHLVDIRDARERGDVWRDRVRVRVTLGTTAHHYGFTTTNPTTHHHAHTTSMQASFRLVLANHQTQMCNAFDDS